MTDDSKELSLYDIFDDIFDDFVIMRFSKSDFNETFFEKIEKFIEAGGDINQSSRGRQPLLQTVIELEVRPLPFVKMLVKFGADVNKQCLNGWTAAHFACASNKPITLRFLLENGADHTIKNNSGNTILDIANRRDSGISCLEILQELPSIKSAKKTF